MSWRRDLADWVEDKVDDITAFRKVSVIKRPEEFQFVIQSPPSAAIIVGMGTDTGKMPDTTSQLIRFPVFVYYSAQEFTGIESKNETNEAYALYDEIFHKLTDPSASDPTRNPLPTGCYSPLRLRHGLTLSIQNSLVVEEMEFDTTIIMEK